MDFLGCSGCGAELSPRWVICPECAHPITNAAAREIHCTQCKGRIQSDSQICPHCHAPIIRRYCSGCDVLIPDQCPFCPHCNTPATAKRSYIRRFWKPAAAAASLCVVAFGVYWLQNSGVNPSPAPFAQKGQVRRADNQLAELSGRDTGATAPPVETPKGESPLPEPVSTKTELPDTETPEASSTNTLEAAAHVEADPAVMPATTDEKPPAPDLDLVTYGARLTEGRKLAQIGSRLLDQRRYAEAVSVLSNAVEAFPPGTHDLSYGLALFKYGNALRLNGQTKEAMPILQRATQFAVIRSHVLREIQTVRLEAQRSPAQGPR